MSTRLCAVCNGIFTGLLVDYRRMPHHQSVASLRRSADEGCYICDCVLAMLGHTVPNHNVAFSWTLSMHRDKRQRHYGPFTECGHLYYIWFPHYLWRFSFMSTASPDAPIRSVDPGASLIDQAVMETARSWLENCRQNHALCGPVEPAFNPTRLIYIKDTCSVQLIETKQEAKSHAYVAFSHCWGKSETLKLLQDDEGTKGNIEELRSLIQVQRLPTSFREAISVSLALGFRHIWIDSLCIIQNSHDDWAKESAMMKDVYANCSLNLCASAAADSSEASFQRRDRDIFVPLDIEPQWTGILSGNDGEGKLGPLPSDLHRIKFKLVYENIFESEIDNSPLNRRAWVMQERTLSRRHIFMTHHQLWWECRDLCASEVFPAGVPNSRHGNSEADRVRDYTLSTHGHHSPHHGAIQDISPVGQTDNTGGEPARHLPFKNLSEDDMDRLWDSLIERYSRCDLTFPYDKLPALSGLAQIFSVVRGPGFSLDENSYLAGIWRLHLPQALCWNSDFEEDSRQGRWYRPHPYRAPSWSWASVEGLVAASYSWAEPTCCVVDAKVLYEDERYKAGTVKGGILHLRSRLIGPLTYEGSVETNFTASPSLDSRVREAIGFSRWRIWWDERDDGSKENFFSYLDPLPHTVHQDGIVKGTDAVRKRVWLQNLAKEPRIRLFFVPLGRSNKGDLQGLVTCQVVNDPRLEGVDEDAVFQRVGFFENPWMREEVLDLVPERTIAII